MRRRAPAKEPAFFRRHSLAVLAVIAFLLPTIGQGTIRALRSNRNDVKSWLPEAYEETATFRWYWSHFESDAFVVASWEGCTLESPELGAVVAELRRRNDADEKAGNPRLFRDVTSGRELFNRLVEDQGVSPQAAVRRLGGSVVGPDGRQTCLLATISPREIEKWEMSNDPDMQGRRPIFHSAVERLYEAAEKCGIARDQVHLGGPPVDNVAIDVEGERSLVQLLIACGIIGLCMSWWSLRSLRLTVIVSTTALFSAGLSLALVWISGATMNAILMTMPALVFVAAASGAIHLANYYRDAAAGGRVAGAADRALKHAWLPLALATGTTGIGLLSLGVSELTPIRMFGVYSALGIVAAFVMLCTYTPALLEQWRPRRRRRSAPQPARVANPPIRWQPVGRWIIRHNVLVTAACLAVASVGVYGSLQVETSVKLMRLFSPQARIIQDYAWLEKHLGPLVPVEIILRVDQRKCSFGPLEQVRLVRQVQQQVQRMDEVGSALAASTFAPAIPERASFLRRAAWNSMLEKNREELSDYWSQDGQEQLWRISARVGALTDLDYAALVADLRKVVEPVLQSYREGGVEGISATYTGVIPLVDKAQHSLLNGLILGFTGDLLLIGVSIILLMRKFSAGPLLMLPSVFPLALVFGAMGLLGIVVDSGTVMAPAVALGVTVDDAIHFMLWCRRGQQRGMNREQSIMFAYGDCARAIYQSWAVIGLGLCAFALSSFIPTRRFGVLMLTMLTISSIGNLVFLPALLAGPAGHWFWLTCRAKPEPVVPEEQAPVGPHVKWPPAGEPQLAGDAAAVALRKASVSTGS